MEWNYKDFENWLKNGCDKVVGNTIIKLNISNNKLTTLPPEIGNLINLQVINCSGNNLTTLPPEIGNLINLQNFECSYNKLTTLPALLISDIVDNEAYTDRLKKFKQILENQNSALTSTEPFDFNGFFVGAYNESTYLQHDSINEKYVLIKRIIP